MPNLGASVGAGVDAGIGGSYTWTQDLSGWTGTVARWALDAANPALAAGDYLQWALDQIFEACQ